MARWGGVGRPSRLKSRVGRFPRLGRSRQQAYEHLMGSVLFDPDHYSQQVGLSLSRNEAVLHYLATPAAWGLSTHPLFRGSWYLHQYRDVAGSGVPPLAHYLDCGSSEGRWPNPLFDPKWYRQQSPDVVQLSLDPLAHYVEYGSRECRPPHPLFDVAWYRSEYPHVEAAGFEPLAHYLDHGGFDGHRPHRLFDSARYLSRYPDVAASGVNPLVHFAWTGWREKRSPCSSFDIYWYSYTYQSDIPTSQNPLIHFVLEGMERGLHASPAQEECIVYEAKIPLCRVAANVTDSALRQVVHVFAPFDTRLDDSQPENCVVDLVLHRATRDQSRLLEATAPAPWGVATRPDSSMEVHLGAGWIVDLQWIRSAFEPVQDFDPVLAAKRLEQTLRWLEDLQRRIPSDVFAIWSREAGTLRSREYIEKSVGSATRESRIRQRVRKWEARPVAPRRALLISHEESLTGAPIYLEQIAVTLRANGIEPLVVSLRDDMVSDVFARRGIRAFRLTDVRPSSGQVNVTGEWELTAAGAEALDVVLRVFEPDFVVISTIVAADAFRVVSRHGTPVVLLVHEVFGFSPYRFALANNYERGIDRALLGATATVFGSEVAQRAWPNRYGRVVGEVMSSIRRMDTPGGGESMLRHEARAVFGALNDDFVYISIATFEPRKRLEDIVEAFKARSSPGGRLLLIGSGQSDGPIERRLKALTGGDKRITILPADTDLTSYFLAADALILASEQEVFPLVLQEAASFRVPIICARFPGWEESVSEATAATFSVGDVIALTKAMNDIEGDSEGREKRSAAAAARQSEAVERWEGDLMELVSRVWCAPRVMVLPSEWV